jgi:hypothetical protein
MTPVDRRFSRADARIFSFKSVRGPCPSTGRRPEIFISVCPFRRRLGYFP